MSIPPISAALIFDGSSAVPNIPMRLLPDPGSNPDHTWTEEERYSAALQLVAKSFQLIGTPQEVLCETAGRACYDSFGKGRPSTAYHTHLVEVNHGSVWEHAQFTLHFSFPASDQVELLLAVVNRPGVFVTDVDAGSVELHINFRAAREWAAFTPEFAQGHAAQYLHHAVYAWASKLAPQVMQGLDYLGVDSHPCYQSRIIPDPIHPEARWVTLLLTGSRGFSHELVRHKYRTAVSQRSTRYVDEDGSSWVMHPLLLQYLSTSDCPARANNGEQMEVSLRQYTDHAVDAGRQSYRNVVAKLQPWLEARGVDKFTARKQARGAARGYLGNALYTEAVFSASVAQWKRMLRQRACAAADAEIREVFCKALVELKSSRYRADFAGWELIDSPDGIGQIVTAPV